MSVSSGVRKVAHTFCEVRGVKSEEQREVELCVCVCVCGVVCGTLRALEKEQPKCQNNM